MKNSLRIHKWTHNEFNIFILGVLTRPLVLTAEYLFSMICNSKKVYLKDEILVWSARFILERFI